MWRWLPAGSLSRLIFIERAERGERAGPLQQKLLQTRWQLANVLGFQARKIGKNLFGGIPVARLARSVRAA